MRAGSGRGSSPSGDDEGSNDPQRLEWQLRPVQHRRPNDPRGAERHSEPPCRSHRARGFGGSAGSRAKRGRSGDDARWSGDAGPRVRSRRFSSEEGPLEVGQAFGTRYHIIRLLGIGGMGAVYQAWDAELGVAVAIKVIRPEVMADPVSRGRDRAAVQARAAARAPGHAQERRPHPRPRRDRRHQVHHDAVRRGRRPRDDPAQGRAAAARSACLRIARSVVAGLIEAHKTGVVHRDLKPANIMIDAEDEALIMDFGIARSTGQPVAGPMPGNTTIVGDLRRAASTPDATMLGAVIGTVEYMAPEQAKGQPVDQRADIYAFGLILYDMLVGRPRAQHMGSAVAELQARMEQAPPPAKSIVPDIPEALDADRVAVPRARSAKRFQTTQELAAALDRLDDNGTADPHRQARRRTAAVRGRRRASGSLLLARSHLVVHARAGGAGAARAGVGADRRLPEHDQRPDLRPHARADPQARAGRRRLHQRVRPQRHRARSACKPPEKLDERARPGDRGQAGRRRRPVRLGRRAGKRLQRFGQSDAGGDRQGDRDQRAGRRRARTGPWRRHEARD